MRAVPQLRGGQTSVTLGTGRKLSGGSGTRAVKDAELQSVFYRGPDGSQLCRLVSRVAL